MIAAIRIRGSHDAKRSIKDTLRMLNLKRKNACVLLEDTPANQGMLEKAKDFITFGEVSEDTAEKLQDIMRDRTAHLHPPRGGLKSVKRPVHAGGSLGEREDMDDLVERMLP